MLLISLHFLVSYSFFFLFIFFYLDILDWFLFFFSYSSFLLYECLFCSENTLSILLRCGQIFGILHTFGIHSWCDLSFCTRSKRCISSCLFLCLLYYDLRILLSCFSSFNCFTDNYLMVHNILRSQWVWESVLWLTHGLLFHLIGVLHS